MIAGLRGHLLSVAVLESYLRERGKDGSAEIMTTAVTAWRRGYKRLGPSSSVRAVFEVGIAPLFEALGFTPPTEIDLRQDLLTATLHAGNVLSSPPVTIVVTSWAERLDRLWRHGVVLARERGAEWCILTNGTHVRVVDAARLHSRQYTEFDLDVIAEDPGARAAAMIVLAAAAFAALPSTQSLVRQFVEESERHAVAVCRSLRTGVLTAAGALLSAFATRRANIGLDGAFEQALILVYRVLFLLFAEARGLVPVWHPVYRESYSLDALCRSAETSASPVGTWDALRAITRMAHDGCRIDSLRVTPFNGRLFAPARSPLANLRGLDDRTAAGAVLALATTTSTGSGRQRISYRELGVEQLGAVYETLLDYKPERVARSNGSGTRIELKPTHHIRKSTGTFYTPEPLARYLVARTLEPLVRNATPDRILALRVLDPSMGSGAFLVAACRYLARAYESALISTGQCLNADIDEQRQTSIRRLIAERCLFGVDVNPMAVQLARLSLWLTALAADRPLSFLDHHLLTGDSVSGTWLESLRRAPGPVRQRIGALPLLDGLDTDDAVRAAMPVRFALTLEPNDTPAQVRQKERALSELNDRDTMLSRWKRVADLWCATWFASGKLPLSAFKALSDAIVCGHSALSPESVERYLSVAQSVRERRAFFHWELEFPEVFFDDTGRRLLMPGFDAIVGNPPWDMVRADPESAGREGDEAAFVRFARDSGVYRARCRGHANLYHLFLERAIALARPGGRIGLVLPAGAMSDGGSAPLRRMLFSSCNVDAIIGFENRRAIFPVHRSVRFMLVTATSGEPTEDIGCRLGERDPHVLDSLDDETRPTAAWYPVRVSTNLLRRLTGDDLALPDLRGSLDVQIAERCATLFPALKDTRGWGARFGRELNATDDSTHFVARGRGWPVVDGRCVDFFRVDLNAARHGISAQSAATLLGRRAVRPRLAYRDVASATNRRTLIAAILPAHCVSTHTVFCLKTPLTAAAQHLLCALFNSFVVDYLVRLRVSTHVTTSIVEQLPVPTVDDDRAVRAELIALARRLRRGPDLAASARLNALVAHVFQLSAEELSHVLSLFPLVVQDERAAVMSAFRVLR